MITLSTLTDGLLGAVCGAIAVFAATALTLWRTRVGDRRRESIRLAELDKERRTRTVAAVIASLRALEREVRWMPFQAGRAEAGMLEAAMLLYLLEHEAHPLITRWMLAQHAEFAAAVATWRSVWFVPVLSQRRLQPAGQILGEIIGNLVAWATGQLSDESFADPHHRASMIGHT